MSQRNVEAFHRSFGLPVADRTTIPHVKRVLLRQRLIEEEYKEVQEELERIIRRLNNGTYRNAAMVYEDIANLAKELSDLRFVAFGTDVEFGIPGEAVDLEVYRSNMSKLWPDGSPRHRHDGKVLKPPTYRAPDIMQVLGIIEGSTSP
jgi:predicted HAD superfamily Cof-like phosphohydrolase